MYTIPVFIYKIKKIFMIYNVSLSLPRYLNLISFQKYYIWSDIYMQVELKKSNLSKILLMNWYLHTSWVKKIKSFLRFWSLFKENWEICECYIDDISEKKT